MNNKKIMLIFIPIIAIIIAGVVMMCVKGFNYSLLYSNTQRLNIYMNRDFDINDIQSIAKEVFGDKNVKVQKADKFGTVASIVANEITEEEQNSLIEKFNAKYEITLNKDTDMVLMNIPQVKMWSLISKYISPLLIITIISVLYFAVRFRKKGIIQTVAKPVMSLILIMALYFSIIALIRIPVNEFFVILAILIYILTLICNTMKLSKAEN